MIYPGLKKSAVKITCLILILTALPSIGAAGGSNPNIGYLLADPNGIPLLQQNIDTEYIPASTLKILTSLFAIDALGPDYRFPTHIFYDPETRNLYIKGFGDPLFISEIIEKIVKDVIVKTGLKRVHHIFLDTTFFSPGINIPGQGSSLNPYDATIGALSANFNTVFFQWDASQKAFVSAEPQTPLLPVHLPRIKATGMRKGRIILPEKDSQQYAGQLIRAFLQKNNIRVTGTVTLGKFPITKDHAMVFLSPFTLKDILEKLLEYSNNFMANQLLLTIGAEKYGSPADLSKGIRAFRQYAAQKLALKNITLEEGAGLSRNNRLSPQQMIQVLIQFAPYHHLLKSKGNDYYKTGTLQGVRTKAGYIEGCNGALYPYVVMINQSRLTYHTICKQFLKTVKKQKNP